METTKLSKKNESDTEQLCFIEQKGRCVYLRAILTVHHSLVTYHNCFCGIMVNVVLLSEHNTPLPSSQTKDYKIVHSPLSMHHYGVRANTGWLVMIYSSDVSVVSVIQHNNNPINQVDPVQNIHCYYLIKKKIPLTPKKLLTWYFSNNHLLIQ